MKRQSSFHQLIAIGLSKPRQKDTFEAIVPAEQINPEFDFMYFVKIMDNDRHGIIYPDLNKETPYIIVKLIR